MDNIHVLFLKLELRWNFDVDNKLNTFNFKCTS